MYIFNGGMMRKTDGNIANCIKHMNEEDIYYAKDETKPSAWGERALRQAGWVEVLAIAGW